MLIKSQDGDMLFNFGDGCFIDIRPTRDWFMVRAFSSTDSDYTYLGEYQCEEHAQVILNGIFNSYSNGEKCFDIGFADARHWGDGETEI